MPTASIITLVTNAWQTPIAAGVAAAVYRYGNMSCVHVRVSIYRRSY